ncbi:MAG: amidase [Gemmatimonadetes bacterium]|nr:amidase [Gemmatimonadota bacterium]
MREGRRRLRPGAVSALAISGGLVAAACAAAGPEPEPVEVVEATLAELQDAIRGGRTTCRMVVQAYLERIERYDGSTGLHAITEVNPRALTVADSIDAALAAGETPGPLFCAPLLVKDNFDTHDLPTTGGSAALLGSLPPDDATMVERVRRAGAIVLAKTNMAEWAFSPRQTVSSSYGTTANAYALDRVPAGSSGGTASGVAASFGVAGLGSDTGNSIRGPSSHLALFGIRSTIGLTSRDGVIPLAFDRDIAGPMARTVEDAARIFTVVAGYDPKDPYTETARDFDVPDYTTFLDANGLQGARVGVLRTLVDRPDADTAVTRVFEAALTDLTRLGAVLVDPFEVPGFEDHLRARTGCSRFRYDVARYLETLGEKAPIHDVMEAYESKTYSPYIEERLAANRDARTDVAPPAWDPPCPDYTEHPARMAYRDAVVAAMDAADVQAIVYPTWRNPPAHLDRAEEEYKGDNSQLVAPATGLPAATVPMGWTYGELPAGLQLLARPFDEGTLFRLAYAYEQGTHHRHAPAGFPSLRPSEASP